LASGASVAAIGSVNPEIDPVTSAPVGKQLISEEEISEVSWATFHVFAGKVLAPSGRAHGPSA